RPARVDRAYDPRREPSSAHGRDYDIKGATRVDQLSPKARVSLDHQRIIKRARDVRFGVRARKLRDSRGPADPFHVDQVHDSTVLAYRIDLDSRRSLRHYHHARLPKHRASAGDCLSKVAR